MAKRKMTDVKERRRKRKAAHCDAASGQPGRDVADPKAGMVCSRPHFAHNQIAERAYLTSIAEGCPEGRAAEHWHRAEGQLWRRDMI